MAATFDSHFELIIPKGAEKAEVKLGSEITIPCHLSPGAQFGVDTDIKWFKETDLVCHYENGRVKEGKDYKNRAGLFTEELNKGNVSLSLKEFKESDFGDYLCQVTCGNRRTEQTIKVEDIGKKKKERNKIIGFTVGAIAVVTLPVAGAAVLAGGVAYGAAALFGGGLLAVTTALVMIYQILFSMIKRIYNVQERQAMEKSLQFVVSCSEQARQEMEGSAPLTERRNSKNLDPPTMSE